MTSTNPATRCFLHVCYRTAYYTSIDYDSWAGSTPSLAGGNLQGSYQIRSFRPQ
ncbi:hypothetical protein AB0I60_37175 [Actinosynnema sp. NPDC050436]|uniref:hypothetical protein n=1 Tax=Actinosynnema sp. NPDC050436 TaxID=3155659 RepID=UPI0033ECFFD8